MFLFALKDICLKQQQKQNNMYLYDNGTMNGMYMKVDLEYFKMCIVNTRVTTEKVNTEKEIKELK